VIKYAHDTLWIKNNNKNANDIHCLAVEQYLKLFETETILANSETQHHNVSDATANTTTTSNRNHDYTPLYTFEKTPMYFCNPEIPPRIRHTVPWSKVILILRNPIDRLYSQYKMTIKDVYNLRQYSLEDMIHHELKGMKYQLNMTTIPLPIPANITSNISTTIQAKEYKMPTFENNNTNTNNERNDSSSNYYRPIDTKYWTPKRKAISQYIDKGKSTLAHQILVRRGLYSTQLKWWLKYYTINGNLLLINYDDLLQDTYSVYLRILDFANIPSPPLAPTTTTNISTNNTTSSSSNTTTTTVIVNYKHKVREDKRKSDRPLQPTTRQYLKEFYQPYNQELAELLAGKTKE